MMKFHTRARWIVPTSIVGCLLTLFIWTQPVGAINRLPSPNPQPGSYGLEATKKQPPPTVAATITTPGNGGSFTTSPVTVAGICPTGLLVEVYNNDVLVGSVMCVGNSFSVQVTLFNGTNVLKAIVYDDLEQAGPASNNMTVNYSNSTLTAFGQLITLTSQYGRRSSPVGTQLQWPLQLSGGTGPYAFSIDWGDGTATELKSQSFPGDVTIAHTFKVAGIYSLNVKVTDVNGVSAFLQMVGVSSGQPAAVPATTTPTKATTTVIWIPAVIALILLLPTYWLGRRSQLVSIRNKMLKERDQFEEKK